MIRVTKRNILANNPAYQKIMLEYNKQLAEKGSVVSKEFFNTVIKPEIPSYSLQSWYRFVKKFKTEAGLIEMQISPESGSALINADIEQDTTTKLVANENATSKGITAALNLGAVFYENLWTKYQEGKTLTQFEEKVLSQCLFGAMKAQDSRIHALGKVNEEKREDMKMQKAFDNAMYE